MAWTPIRTLTAQAAEASAPISSAYLALSDYAKYVELAVDSLTLGGSATAVVLGIWRHTDGASDLIGQVTLTAPTPQATLIDFFGDQIAVTVLSFTGGTSPTASGTIRVREIDA